MQYKILESKEVKELEKLVNAAIQEGWRPIGGVTYTLYVEFWCAQALVKGEN